MTAKLGVVGGTVEVLVKAVGEGELREVVDEQATSKKSRQPTAKERRSVNEQGVDIHFPLFEKPHLRRR